MKGKGKGVEKSYSSQDHPPRALVPSTGYKGGLVSYQAYPHPILQPSPPSFLRLQVRHHQMLRHVHLLQRQHSRVALSHSFLLQQEKKGLIENLTELLNPIYSP